MFEEYKIAKAMFDVIFVAYGTTSYLHDQLLIESYNGTKNKVFGVEHVNKMIVFVKKLVAYGNSIPYELQVFNNQHNLSLFLGTCFSCFKN